MNENCSFHLVRLISSSSPFSRAIKTTGERKIVCVDDAVVHSRRDENKTGTHKSQLVSLSSQLSSAS